MPDRLRLPSAELSRTPRSGAYSAHDDESIARPFAFYQKKSEAFDDQLTVFSQKNYRKAQSKFFDIQDLFLE